MSTSPKATPPSEDAAASTLVLLLKNPWLLLILGFTGGGGIGTLLGRPVYSAVGGEIVTREDVQEIVDEAITQNNAVLLQQIELLLARDKLADVGLSVPALAPD